MNYFSFHIGDYRAATAHLSNEEDLAYRRLLEMYYDTEKPIPVETQWVSRRLRVPVEVVEIVLSDFFNRTDDGWHNERCDAEIAAYHRNADKNRTNGKLGGRPRAAPTAEDNPVGSQVDSQNNPVETDWKGNQEPRTNNQEPMVNLLSPSAKAQKKCRIPADFYPNEPGVKKAEDSSIALAVELEKFRDFHTAKGSLMADWQAAWRTWVGNAVKFGRARAGPAGYAAGRDEQRARASEILTGRGRENGGSDGSGHVFNGEAARVA